MWKHKSKFKKYVFIGTHEYNRAGKRIFVLKNVVTGRELKFKSHEDAKANGFVKVQGV